MKGISKRRLIKQTILVTQPITVQYEFYRTCLFLKGVTLEN